LRYFVAVAEELHFGRAAARLHIAQPSLSHQIRRLEQQLGVTLLERTSRRVTLTPAGQTLLLDGRRLLKQAERVVRTTRATSSEELAIGFAGSAAHTMLAEVLSAFAERHPSVNVAVHELLLDRVDDIRSGRVDIAFTRLLPGQTDLDIEVLTHEPRLVAVPAAHRLAARAAVAFADLRDESFITNPLVDQAGPPERWLREQRRHGLPGRVAAEAASVPEILTLVAAARGVCLVPAAVATHHPREDLRYIPLTDADPAVVSLASAPGRQRPTVEAFAAAARDVASRH
jgi:DNA-binding transcriptional LysR family regulator